MAYKKQKGGPKMYRKDKSPTEMASPMKNYKNPQDYKVFNMGNEPTPMKNAGVDEFPEELGLSPKTRGKAVKNHDKVYGTGHTDHPGGQQGPNSPAEMKSSGFKMKSGSPMKRNFGIGASPVKAVKPDYPDIDGDGNTTESMKQAAADKKGSMNKMKSPLEAMGGKFKFDDSGEYPTKTQISDQEYAEILAKEAELEKQSDALIAERDANMNTNSYAIYDKKSEELYKDNPIPRTGTEGLDYTTGKYKSLAEAQEALSTMDPKSEEYNDLANTIHFELGDRGKKMTAEQRRLSMDKS